jgi:Protein of unknown function (DUF3489)
MDVIAVITAQGENTMNEIPEQPANIEASTPAAEPAATKRPRGRTQTRHVAPAKGKSGPKASSEKKAREGAKAAKPAKNGKRARQGSKTAKVLDLLKRPTGATGADLMKATGWQAHSVRGFISGVLGKKLRLKVMSTVENGERRYALKG